MKKCPHCQFEYESSPRFCPNCGRVNSVDVMFNMYLAQQRIEEGNASQDDFDFINTVQKEVASAKPVDIRSPLDKIFDWRGWLLIALIAGALAIWGNLNEFLEALLFGVCLSVSGFVALRMGTRGRGEIYAIVFFVAGLAIMAYAIYKGIISIF